MEPVTTLVVLGGATLAMLGAARRGRTGRAPLEDSAREDIPQASGMVPAPAEGWDDFALDTIGKPYVWGASGPDEYDCSGLVYAAMKQGLIRPNVGRLTADGYARTLAPRSGKIRAGDVLCYGTPAGTTHVAIAASDEDSSGRLLVLSASGSKAKGGSVKAYDTPTFRRDYIGARMGS